MKAAQILVINTPIKLGKTSICTKVIERLYSSSGDLNEHGQYAYYASESVSSPATKTVLNTAP